MNSGACADEAFDAEQRRAISEAVEDLCTRLNFPPTATGARMVITRRVIMMARRGERSAGRLRDAVLAQIGIEPT